MDRERIERAVRELLEAVGEDPQREGLQETPRPGGPDVPGDFLRPGGRTPGNT